MKIIEKHPLWLRIVHWINVPLLSLMIWSGILIYWASDIYPGFFPQSFYDFFGISGRLAEGLAIHFLIAWFFILNGLVYLTLFLTSGHWREVFPTRKTLREVIPVVLNDLGLVPSAPPSGKFNAAQRLAYTGAIFLGLLGVLTGFAIYKPVQLGWLTSCFGGYMNARLIHFVVMLAFVGFIVTHLVQVARTGWNNFRAMVAGFEWKTHDPEN